MAGIGHNLRRQMTGVAGDSLMQHAIFDMALMGPHAPGRSEGIARRILGRRSVIGAAVARTACEIGIDIDRAVYVQCGCDDLHARADDR